MATVTITTTPEERHKVFESLKELQGETISMSKIAKHCGLKVSRVRYAIEDLMDANLIRKVPTKSLNPRYIRYKYEIV